MQTVARVGLGLVCRCFPSRHLFTASALRRGALDGGLRLSEEKRDGTLGLLSFLTDLKGYGRGGRQSWVATSPEFFLRPDRDFPGAGDSAALMGGITNGEFWRMAAGAREHLPCFRCALGMFVSSISKHPRKSMAATHYSAPHCFAIGLPVLENMDLGLCRRSPFRLTMVLTAVTPETSFLGLVYDADYVRAPEDILVVSPGATHGLCWLLLAHGEFDRAALVVQDNPPGAKVQRWRELWHRWSYGDADERCGFPQALVLDINAFFWLKRDARGSSFRRMCGSRWSSLHVCGAWGAIE